MVADSCVGARRDLDDKIDAALKGPKKKKKKNDVDLDDYNDELIIGLKTKMMDAASRDADAIGAGQPAVHKLAMLDEVKEVLQRPNLMATAMDNNFLEAMRQWLEPLPNKSLPAYSIQKLMFEIMGKMKITTDYLRESGIGKVVMFYTKDKRPQLHIKREADRLIGEWSRPILGRSDDYHSREIPMANREYALLSPPLSFLYLRTNTALLPATSPAPASAKKRKSTPSHPRSVIRIAHVCQSPWRAVTTLRHRTG